MKNCVLDDRFCNQCGECDLCDLEPSKVCDNCMECLDTDLDYKVIQIDEVITGNSKKKH